MGKNNKLFLLMPNHRRNASKFTPVKQSIDDRRSEPLGPQSVVIPPKHITLPKLSQENELLFEAQTILLFVVAMIAQYLNLYRSVWWLPQSYNSLSMNFHLIDLNAVQFSTLFIGRAFILNLAQVFSSTLPPFFRNFYQYFMTFLIHLLCVWGHVRCSMHIYHNHGITGILCISYPIVIYMLMYSPNLINAYENSKTTGQSVNWLLAFKYVVLPNQFSNETPQHICTSNVEMIREEVDKLKSTFNERLKFILFRSLLIAYYSTFVPLCFAQTHLFYDVSWTAQHVVITWLSSFLSLTSHLYSPNYYDILHRSALHLGRWQKLEQRNTLVPCNVWSDSTIYGHGVVVKHLKEYFKSEGGNNCAEPGNQSHLRYFIVFANPIGGFGTLIGLLILLILFEMVLLIRSYEWYKLISMAIMVLANTLTVFRLIRTFYVLKEVYKIEAKLQENLLQTE